jgi:N-formylglutamate deformylase
MSDGFSLERGRVPVLVSFPHDGVLIPPAIESRMTPAALRRPDTDWHVSRLYAFVDELGPSRIRAHYSRYVVDLNRDPEGADLYPGADNTDVVPTTSFDREALYRVGQEPSAGERSERIARWFAPYHQALASEVERLVELHGVAVVFDAHSIRSEVPRFFQGVLPDLNLGTAAGRSAAPELADRVFAALGLSTAFSRVRDGRFQGGYITRHYGRPEQNVHALQLELAQKNYMCEAFPYEFDELRVTRLRPVLRAFVEALIDWAQRQAS